MFGVFIPTHQDFILPVILEEALLWEDSLTHELKVTPHVFSSQQAENKKSTRGKKT